jgi:hypothetical protein
MTDAHNLGRHSPRANADGTGLELWTDAEIEADFYRTTQERPFPNADLIAVQRQIEARAYQNTLDQAADPNLNPCNGYLNTLDEAKAAAIAAHQELQRRGALMMPTRGYQPPAQLIDTWSQHIQAQARITDLEVLVANLSGTVDAQERELETLTAELAYANLRMTVAIQTSNQLIEAEVDRRKAEATAAGAAYARHRAEALRIIDMAPAIVPSLVCTCRDDSVAGSGFGLCPACYPTTAHSPTGDRLADPQPDLDAPTKPAFPARALIQPKPPGWEAVR